MKLLHHFLLYTVFLFLFFDVQTIDLAHYQTSCGPLPIFFHVTACVQDSTTNKAIVAGYYTNGSGIKQMFVARLVTDGTSFDDTQYGEDPVGTCYYPEQTTAPKSGYTVLGHDTLQESEYENYNFTPTDIIVDDSDSVVVVGIGFDASLSTNPTDIFIAKFTSDLILDNTFNSIGFVIIPATGLGITQPSPPAVQIGVIPDFLYFDSTESTYMFLVHATNNIQSGIVSIHSADGSFNDGFNSVGYAIFSSTDFGGQETDYLAFNAFTKGTDSAANQNYYLVGAVGLNGLVVALTTTGVLQTTGTFGTTTGFVSLTSANLGQDSGKDLQFFGIVQNAASTNFYIVGECSQDIIFINLLQNGSGLNAAFNNSGNFFGNTPGVAVVTGTQLGSSTGASVYNFYRDSTNNLYASGILGTNIFLASIAANGNTFNTTFGTDGVTLFNKSVFGFSTLDQIANVMWKPKGAFDPLQTSFFLATNSNSYQRNTASFVQLEAQAADINSGYGNAGSTYDIFAQVFYYQQHLVLDIQNVNIHVTSLETPVGQCIQLLEETDNPLSPLKSRSLHRHQVVFNITDSFFDGDKIVVVGTQFGVQDASTSVPSIGFIVRFNADYRLDQTFNALGTPGHKKLPADLFGGVDTDPVIIMAGIQDETDGNYFIGGSIKIAPQVFYRALLTKVQNDGSGLDTTFNPTLGYRTYYSDSTFGGTAGTNSVFTVLFQSPVGTSTENQVYALATTNILAATDIVPYFYPITESGTVTVNGGDLVGFAQVDMTSGSLINLQSINQSIFVFYPAANIPDIQPIDILQVPHTQLPDGSLEENAFYVGLNLIGTEFHSAVESNYFSVLKYHADLSGLVDDGSYGYARDPGIRGFGISIFDSYDFGINIQTTSLVAGTTLDMLNNENVLFAGYACEDYSAVDPVFRTLIIQMQADGTPNQRFNTTGYRLGGTGANERGYMTSFAGGVLAASGFDGGIFVFGQGVSSALKNVIEAALRRRYGL